MKLINVATSKSQSWCVHFYCPLTQQEGAPLTLYIFLCTCTQRNKTTQLSATNNIIVKQ